MDTYKILQQSQSFLRSSSLWNLFLNFLKYQMPLKAIKIILSHWTILLRPCCIYLGNAEDRILSRNCFTWESWRCWEERRFICEPRGSEPLHFSGLLHVILLSRILLEAAGARRHLPHPAWKSPWMKYVSLGTFSPCCFMTSRAARLPAST